MKIAILNRDPNAYPGGDILSIDDIIVALGKYGVESRNIYGPWTPDDLKEYDLVHIRHCNFGWSWHNFQQTWQSGVPYVLTPMFYPTFKLGMGQEQIKEAVQRAEAIIPFSATEWSEMSNFVGVGHERVYYVPNGTNSLFHCTTPIGFRTGVVTVAARRGDKYTDLVESLCKDAHLPFVQACEVSYEKMPELYAKSRVYVCASGSERMSRTTGEALCAGCRVLASIHNRGNEWYEPGLVKVDPLNPDYMGAMISWAYFANEEDWNYGPNEAARNLTWSYVAERLIRVYEEVLDARA